MCGINGYQEVHHRLLHKDKASQDKVIEPEKKEEFRLISRKEEHAMKKSSFPNEVEQDDKIHQDGMYTMV